MFLTAILACLVFTPSTMARSKHRQVMAIERCKKQTRNPPVMKKSASFLKIPPVGRTDVMDVVFDTFPTWHQHEFWNTELNFCQQPNFAGSKWRILKFNICINHPQMTVEVAAGAEDCFFLPEVKTGQTIELEFQVISCWYYEASTCPTVCQ